MPELPEVQTIVDGLNKKVKKRRITGVWFDAPKLITLQIPQGDGERSRTIKKPKPSEFEKKIKGLKIIEAKRLGKNILIYLSGGHILLIHLKMTGHLLYGKWSIRKAQPSPMARGIRTRSREYQVESLISGALREKVNNYIHVIFYLDNGYQLALSDLRKFAKVIFGKIEKEEEFINALNIGPDPLDKNFNVKKFVKLIKLKKGRIKQVLMDQKTVSGIGNIYSDEILWSVKINPLSRTENLKEKDFKKIYSETLKILKRAIKLRGSSISDYRDLFGKPGAYADNRFVYGREGQPCGRCGTAIKRVKIGGRSAHFCPACQRL